ncbi:CueP family metal-binding protein [Nocardioides sp. Bht2]|uniref:CueP family metal-binding protein n=1 Tax=Nocardioides sp. Bht2 TaxID=3392297 RepID=UPI0039B57D25
MRSPTRLVTFAAGLLLAASTFAACSESEDPTSTGTITDTASTTESQALLTKHGLAGMDAREVIEELEAKPLDERDEALRASVTPTAVTLSEDGTPDVVFDLGDEEFYLSVAPFATSTHDCVMHSLSGCRGELRATPVTVTATDASTGEVVRTVRTRTQDNGFAGLWLPRDRKLTIAVQQGERSGSATISTDAEAPTCLTTIRLA